MVLTTWEAMVSMTLCRVLTRLVKSRRAGEGRSWTVVMAQAGAEAGNGKRWQTQAPEHDGFYDRSRRAEDGGCEVNREFQSVSGENGHSAIFLRQPNDGLTQQRLTHMTIRTQR